MVAGVEVRTLDAFDLPDWLGVADVVWTALSSVIGAERIEGSLRGPAGEIGCDLLAADVAYPQPLLADDWRRQAHQAWQHGQVLLLWYDDRPTLVVPGTAYSADGVLESVARLAKAVGAQPERFTVCLRL